MLNFIKRSILGGDPTREHAARMARRDGEGNAGIGLFFALQAASTSGSTLKVTRRQGGDVVSPRQTLQQYLTLYLCLLKRRCDTSEEGGVSGAYVVCVRLMWIGHELQLK
jgi:hypothetical protein